ncbi:MAG: DNA-protecting protein DprA [Silvanigrellaceae bacterium]|nr:DNA-protecting protein DprA [Silvanigrellaceae bacterium]
MKNISKDKETEKIKTSKNKEYINKYILDDYDHQIQINKYLKVSEEQLPRHLPKHLKFLGNKNILTKPIVGIVGSRKPTFYGRQEAYRFSKELAQAGITVLSGGAIGIDTIANATALEFGSSIAVLGSGLKALYPQSNIGLFKRMAHSNQGLLLSQFNDFEMARKYHFPLRNQVIAMLCDFLMIIEAACTSGSLITANAALEYGVDIGALPGPVDSPNSQGTNLLIKNGAFCIQSPKEIIEHLSYQSAIQK